MRQFGDSAVCGYHFGYISLSSPKRSHLGIPCTCDKMSNRTKASEQLDEFAKNQKKPDVLTTGTGCPIDTKTATMTAGPRGPILLQDAQFLDEMSHFDRERIPERVVHAKGGGAFGYFEVTHDITKYCKVHASTCYRVIFSVQ